jgi:hypothetical protein
MINGGKRSNSQDIKVTFEKVAWTSSSKINQKQSKTDVVEENVGGGASAVEVRRRPVFVVSM